MVLFSLPFSSLLFRVLGNFLMCWHLCNVSLSISMWPSPFATQFISVMPAKMPSHLSCCYLGHGTVWVNCWCEQPTANSFSHHHLLWHSFEQTLLSFSWRIQVKVTERLRVNGKEEGEETMMTMGCKVSLWKWVHWKVFCRVLQVPD